jgi:hypothetical protein
MKGGFLAFLKKKMIASSRAPCVFFSICSPVHGGGGKGKEESKKANDLFDLVFKILLN